MDHEEAKKVARAAFSADGGGCVACTSDVIQALIEELPQFDWVAIAEEVAHEKDENGEELCDFFTYIHATEGSQ